MHLPGKHPLAQSATVDMPQILAIGCSEATQVHRLKRQVRHPIKLKRTFMVLIVLVITAQQLPLAFRMNGKYLQ